MTGEPLSSSSWKAAGNVLMSSRPHFVANQLHLPALSRSDGRGEGPITSEHTSLISLMSFHGMREIVLNTPEGWEKAPTQKREVGTYLEAFYSFRFSTLPLSVRVGHGLFLAISSPQIWGFLLSTESLDSQVTNRYQQSQNTQFWFLITK